MHKASRDDKRDRSAESGQIRRFDVSDEAALAALIEVLEAGLSAGDVDAEHRYAASCLRQHVAARRQQIEERTVDARFAGDLHRLANAVTTAFDRAARLEDAVSNVVAGGGSLDAYESAALIRLLHDALAALDQVREREVDARMNRHWVDLGESG